MGHLFFVCGTPSPVLTSCPSRLRCHLLSEVSPGRRCHFSSVAIITFYLVPCMASSMASSLSPVLLCLHSSQFQTCASPEAPQPPLSPLL